MTTDTIYVVDRVLVRSGHAREFIDAYLDQYVPRATARGLVLDRLLMPPPVWDDDEEHVVTATWTVEGPKEWWAAAVAARHDPTASDWWRAMEPMVIERTRTTEAEPAAVERMSRV